VQSITRGQGEVFALGIRLDSNSGNRSLAPAFYYPKSILCTPIIKLIMTSFELRSSVCDGHIRTLAKTIALTSKISADVLLEFTTERMRVCAKSDLTLVKFNFMKEFFAEYECDRTHRCYVSAKALLGPAKSMIRLSEPKKSSGLILVNCTLEDEFNNKLIFNIRSASETASITYHIFINDLSPNQRAALNAINRKIEYWRIEISPKQDLRGYFLLPTLNDFPEMMDQVTIRCSPSEIRFTASTSPINHFNRATSEVVQKRDLYQEFEVKENVYVTLPLRFLRRFVKFAETTDLYLSPNYIFEGFGMPAHFEYKNPYFKAQHISSTSIDFIPDTLGPVEDFSQELFCYDRVEQHLIYDFEEECNEERDTLIDTERSSSPEIEQATNQTSEQKDCNSEPGPDNHSYQEDIDDDAKERSNLTTDTIPEHVSKELPVLTPNIEVKPDVLNDILSMNYTPSDTEENEIDYSSDSGSGI
jgi:hypothetical protein